MKSHQCDRCCDDFEPHELEYDGYGYYHVCLECRLRIDKYMDMADDAAKGYD